MPILINIYLSNCHILHNASKNKNLNDSVKNNTEKNANIIITYRLETEQQ